MDGKLAREVRRVLLRTGASLWCATICCTIHPLVCQAEEETKISFIKDVAPIVTEHCAACHGVRASKSNYRLDSFEHLLQAGDYEVAPIVPGNAAESELFRLVSSDDESERMPYEAAALSEAELRTIESWINQGAEFDGDDRVRPLVEMLNVQHPSAPEKYNTPVPITALAFHPEKDELFAAGYHEITVWNPDEGELLRRIGDVAERTYAIAFHPDGKQLAVAGGAPGQRGEVRLIDDEKSSVSTTLTACDGVVLAIAFDSEGKRLAAAGEDRSIRIFDVATGKLEQEIENHADWVLALDWSSDGKQIVSTSRDKTAKVFEVESGNLVATYAGHGATVFDAVFSPDDKHVYSAGADDKIHMWNVPEAKKQKEAGGHGQDILKLLLIDGKLTSASADRTARQFDLGELKELKVLKDHSDWVCALAYDARNKRLASGCFDGNVRTWNLETGEPVLSFVAVPGIPAKAETQ